MKRVFWLVCVAATLAIRAEGAVHESPCSHTCNSPSCVVANIEAFERGENAACANYDDNSSTAVPAVGTSCTRVDAIGAKKEAKTTLSCANGSCMVTGQFKCPSAQGFLVVPISGSFSCPAKNIGGQMVTPDVVIWDKTNYGWGTGTQVQCSWPDGTWKFLSCNEQDGGLFTSGNW